MCSVVGHCLFIALSVLLPLCLGTLQKVSKPAWPVTTSPSDRVYVRDVWDRGFSRPHPELCPRLGADLRLLILVTSDPRHVASRDAVRLTWGYYGMRSDITLAFVIGTAPALESHLAAEDDLYGDLIQSRSIDTYFNLTLKTVAMLDWARTYCPRVPFLLKTDDDMFINVPEILRFLSGPRQANTTRTIWGFVLHGVVPNRSIEAKHYASESQFSGSVFPDFVMGAAYLLTTDCIEPLVAAAPSEVYIRLEDVFVTGVLAQKIAITREHEPKLYKSKKAAHPCTIQRGYAMHRIRFHEQFDFWRKLLDGTTKCVSKVDGSNKTFSQKYFNLTG